MRGLFQSRVGIVPRATLSHPCPKAIQILKSNILHESYVYLCYIQILLTTRLTRAKLKVQSAEPRKCCPKKICLTSVTTVRREAQCNFTNIILRYRLSAEAVVLLSSTYADQVILKI